MHDNKIFIITLSTLLVLALFMSGLSMITPYVAGANKTNYTALAKVWVWNTQPTLYQVIVSPSSIDLNPGNTTTVNCTGFAYDYNGWQDINYTNATFYHNYFSENADSDDNNYHYTTYNCSCGQQGSSSTNASCSCFFEVEYYAFNGTWTCNMTIHDKGGNATERIYNFNSTNNGSAYVNTVLGIDVPPLIDYGNLSVTEISNFIPLNVTNWGNVPINVSVRGYGGTNRSTPGVGNFSMLCDLGNISIANEKYSLNTTIGFENMTNLTSNFLGIPNLRLGPRTNDSQYENDTNLTYWRLQIPLSVGGYCNGTVEFLATQTEAW